MDGDDHNQAQRQSLPVLPHSGKVEKLRKEPAESAPGAPRATSAPAGAAGPAPHPGGPSASHVNRIESSGLGALDQKPLEQKVVQALRSVYDPEIPINIYDLGLIYDINVDSEARVHVRMTLTAPGCPVAGSLPPEVERRIEAIPEIKSAQVELVWEPQWSREMMSEVARLELDL